MMPAETDGSCLEKQPISITHAIDRQRDLSNMKIVQRKSIHRAESDVLGFMIRRVEAAQVRMQGAAKGVHVQLYELCCMLRELQTMSLPDVDVVAAFVSEVTVVTKLGELPTQSVMQQFLSQMDRFQESPIQIGCKSVPFSQMSWLQWGCPSDCDLFKKIGYEYEVSEEESSKAVDTARNWAIENYDTMSQEYGRFPVLQWVLQALSTKIATPGPECFLATNIAWECDVPSFLPWTIIAEVLLEAIEDSCLKEADVGVFLGEGPTAFRKGVREIHAKVLPLFQFRLTQWKSVLDAQISMSAEMKAKTIAALVAACVTIGQFVGQFLFNYFFKESIKGNGEEE